MHYRYCIQMPYGYGAQPNKKGFMTFEHSLLRSGYEPALKSGCAMKKKGEQSFYGLTTMTVQK
jgi:hypothetical protein